MTTPTPNPLIHAQQGGSGPIVRIARYARISEDPSGMQVGVERQLVDIDAYIVRHPNWTVVDTFVDDDKPAYRKPGEAPKLRPEYARLLKCARAREFDVVVGYHTSRWHRDIMEYLTFTELLKATSIGWHTAAEGEIRFENATDAATSLTRAVWNQHESALKSERVTRAKLDIAKAGKFNGGMRPYGYDIDNSSRDVNGGLIIREREADVIREIAPKFLRGVSLRSMAFDLNKRGIPTARATGPWMPAHIGSLLARPTIAGLRKHGPDTLYPALWEPILTRDTWEAIQAILSDPSRLSRVPTKGPTPRRLGTGIYICGVCKRPTLRSTGGGAKRAGSYGCGEASDHVARRIDKLDAYVEGAVIDKLSQAGVVAAAVARAHAGEDVELSAMRAELKDNETAQAQLGQLLSTPGVATAVVLSTSTAIAELAARAATLSRELAKAGEQSALAPLLGADDVEATWYALTLGEQRAILVETVDVTVRPARHGRGPGGIYFDPSFIDLAFKI